MPFTGELRPLCPVSAERARHHRSATPISQRVTIALGVLVAAQAFAAVAALRTGAGAPVAVLAPLLVALVVGTARLRERPAGPPIHDRQLDLIVAAGAGAGAAALVAAQLTGAGDRLGLLAAAPTAVAVLAAVVGTRRLWQARAVPTVLLLVWPAPWVALAAVAGPGAVPVGGLAGLVVGLAVVLAARVSPRRRTGVFVVAVGGAVAGACAASVITTSGPTLSLVAVLAALLLALPAAGLLPGRRDRRHRAAHGPVAVVPAPRRAPAAESITPAVGLAS